MPKIIANSEKEYLNLLKSDLTKITENRNHVAEKQKTGR